MHFEPIYFINDTYHLIDFQGPLFIATCVCAKSKLDACCLALSKKSLIPQIAVMTKDNKIDLGISLFTHHLELCEK